MTLTRKCWALMSGLPVAEHVWKVWKNHYPVNSAIHVLYNRPHVYTSKVCLIVKIQGSKKINEEIIMATLFPKSRTTEYKNPSAKRSQQAYHNKHRLPKHLKWRGHCLKRAPATTSCIFISCFWTPPPPVRPVSNFK